MSWSTPVDLRAQVQKRWERGEFLRHVVNGEPVFPIRLTLNAPGSSEMTERFDEVRAWILELSGMPHLRIEVREFAHRVLGTNTVPQSAWVDSLEDAVSLIGKRREVACFRSMVDRTRTVQPQLLDWLAKRPLRALGLAEDWDRLLDVVAWIHNHPSPNIYLRQVDIAGVHSKFIEGHRGVLGELLDLVLPSEAVNASCSGGAQFATRYGFREKPTRIRFRALDDRLPLLRGACLPDITLDIDSFLHLDLPVCSIFVTENEINFLSFPPVVGGLVIFGAGYGWEALSKAQWLTRCTLHYWGDIDTHGFAILDQLRSRFGHVESFLMDRETLIAHESLWGREADQVLHDLSRLTGSECALFNDLRDNRIRKNLRLEQEMVGFGAVEAALSRAIR